MSITIQEIEKVRHEMQAKCDRYFSEYQETGIAGKEKTYRKYEQLADICTLALKQVREADDDKARRHRNIMARINDLTEETYTKKQVADLLREISFY